MIWSKDSCKNVFKRNTHTHTHTHTQKKNSTTRPSNLIYCGWIQTKSISILQSADKLTSHLYTGLKTRTLVHSNSICCPGIVPRATPVLCWLSHLTCLLSLKQNKTKKETTLIFTQLKMSRNKQHFFFLAFFRRSLRTWALTYLFTVVWLRYSYSKGYNRELNRLQ